MQTVDVTLWNKWFLHVTVYRSHTFILFGVFYRMSCILYNWIDCIYWRVALCSCVLTSSLIARFMGPIWGRQDPVWTHVGPMNFAICEGFYTLGGKTSYRQISRSLETEELSYNDRIATELGRHLCNAAAQVPVKFQSLCTGWKNVLPPNHVKSRNGEMRDCVIISYCHQIWQTSRLRRCPCACQIP